MTFIPHVIDGQESESFEPAGASLGRPVRASPAWSG
jgi:hypothetical protein